MSRRLFSLIAAFAFTFGIAACTEDLESGAGCPVLCPQVPIELRDTIIEGVVVDSTFSGFPAIGFEDVPLLANRGDTLETRVIVRFDSLPQTVRFAGAATDSTIRMVDSATLNIRVAFPIVDSLATMTISAYDVDTVLPAGSLADTMVATLAPLFRPERLLGSVTFDPADLTDTLLRGDSTVRIPISSAVLLEKITNGRRLRVGFAIESPESVGINIAARPVLRFRVDADSGANLPVQVVPRSLTPDEPFIAAALVDYQIVVRGSPVPATETLAVGGVPGKATYLRFELPRRITDSSRVVRAALLLTQRPNPLSASRSDTLVVLPDVLTASGAITSLERAIRFTSRTFGLGGQLTAVPPLMLVPADSGERVFEIAPLIAAWRATPEDDMPRALVLRAEYLGRVGGTVLFFSREAPASVRPRLRLTYAPRLEFGLP